MWTFVQTIYIAFESFYSNVCTFGSITSLYALTCLSYYLPARSNLRVLPISIGFVDIIIIVMIRVITIASNSRVSSCETVCLLSKLCTLSSTTSTYGSSPWPFIVYTLFLDSWLRATTTTVCINSVQIMSTLPNRSSIKTSLDIFQFNLFIHRYLWPVHLFDIL
jgi:hypothetical protein